MANFIKSFIKFLRFLAYILSGDSHPPIANMRSDREGKIYFAGLVRSLLTIGKPGVGKTRFIAALIVAYMLAFPDQGALVLDASGQLVNDILAIILGLPKLQREQLTKRLVVDILNHDEYTQTQPEFHPAYGVAKEKQIQRVAENLRRLNPVAQEYGVMGKPAFDELGPHAFRLVCVTQDKFGESWQLSEVKKILMDSTQRTLALERFGGRVPESKWFLENFFKLHFTEVEKRSYILRAALDVIEPRFIRARTCYDKPTWTPAEAVEKGLMVLVSGENMLDQELQLNYILTQVYSLCRQEMNKRKPDDPKDKPFLLCIDEAPILFKVPGLAREVGELSTFYRTRKLWLIIIIQALWQLADELKDQVWSLGNICAFAMEDIKDCQEVAQQLFHYDPRMVKQEAKTDIQNPITETDRGQYTIYANWLQSLKQRAMVMRRYENASRVDPFIRYIPRTPDFPVEATLAEIEEFKERIFKQRAIPIREALAVINNRKLVPEPKKTNGVKPNIGPSKR